MIWPHQCSRRTVFYFGRVKFEVTSGQPREDVPRQAWGHYLCSGMFIKKDPKGTDCSTVSFAEFRCPALCLLNTGWLLSKSWLRSLHSTFCGILSRVISIITYLFSHRCQKCVVVTFFNVATFYQNIFLKSSFYWGVKSDAGIAWSCMSHISKKQKWISRA